MDLTPIRIKTDRLMLEPVSMQYKEDIFREFQPPITKYVYSKPAEKIEETETFIKGAKKDAAKGVDVTMVILDKQSGEFLGCTGLHNLEEENPEMGVWIKQSAHGNKYGREAISGLKNWAAKNLQFDHITYTVVVENTASCKLAESLGGKVGREYEKTMQSGNTYHMLEYWLPR